MQSQQREKDLAVITVLLYDIISWLLKYPFVGEEPGEPQIN